MAGTTVFALHLCLNRASAKANLHLVLFDCPQEKPEQRSAQRKLAENVTLLIHGGKSDIHVPVYVLGLTEIAQNSDHAF